MAREIQFQYNRKPARCQLTTVLDAMVHAFGEQQKARVERFYSDYTAKDKMQSRLPETFEKVSPEKRTQVQSSIIEFLTAVRDQNAEFLELCVQTYAQKLHVDE